MDVSGSIFVYRVLIPPAHTTVNQIAKKIVEIEKPLNESKYIVKRLMSHEQSATRDVYNKEHNLGYQSWKIGAHQRDFGIARIREYLELEESVHPFRPQLKRAPKLYFVVADEEGEAFYNEFSKRWKSRPALTQAGLKRARNEMSTYHWSDDGKTPEKFMDDFVDTLRGAAIEFPPKASRSKAEILEESLPTALQAETIKAMPDSLEQGIAYLSRQEHIRSNLPVQGSRYNKLITRMRGLAR